MPLEPESDIHRALFSTPSHFKGMYKTDDALVTHAWPLGPDARPDRMFPGPMSRSTFVFCFRAESEPEEAGPVRIKRQYHGLDRWLCAFLAVFFGKRFDAHGLFESGGAFAVPEMSEHGSPSDPWLPFHTHKPRIDIPVPLNLVEIKRIESLVGSNDVQANSAKEGFTAACRFYLQALQLVKTDAEVAYLHLITAGEVLSNLLEFTKEELLSSEVGTLLDKVKAGLSDGDAVAKQLQGMLRSIKKRYVRTFLRLVDDSFFGRSQTDDRFARINSEDFEKSMGSAYDLRSQYVHSGAPFGYWVRPVARLWERQIGRPITEPNQKLGDTIFLAPTFLGLERVTRYALLKFAESQGWVDLRGVDAGIPPATARESQPT